MKDLKIKVGDINVTFEFGTDMTIIDTHGNRWDGEGEVEFVWINLNTPTGNVILRINDEEMSNSDFKVLLKSVDQYAQELKHVDVVDIFDKNREYFLECYSYILNNPDQNGEA